MVIGLHGAKGSGKDEFFKLLEHKGFTKVAFADPIRNEVCKLFNLKTEKEYDEFKRSIVMTHMGTSVSGRELVRGVGMLMRSYDEEQFNKRVRESMQTGCDIIITDIRFKNEYDMLKGLGVPMVKITRPNDNSDSHITEQEFPDSWFNYVISNNSTLEEYHKQIMSTYKKIKEHK